MNMSETIDTDQIKNNLLEKLRMFNTILKPISVDVCSGTYVFIDLHFIDTNRNMRLEWSDKHMNHIRCHIYKNGNVNSKIWTSWWPLTLFGFYEIIEYFRNKEEQ